MLDMYSEAWQTKMYTDLFCFIYFWWYHHFQEEVPMMDVYNIQASW